MGNLNWKGKKETINDIKNIKSKNHKPLQLIETISSPICIKNALNWINLLICGDTKYVLSSLLDQFKKKIKLIYIDPPFGTGGEFNYKIQIGDVNASKKSSQWIRKSAYNDSWKNGIDSYLNFIYKRLIMMKDLLSDDGSIYVHLDWHVGHYIKVMMDEVFGENNFRNEIIWAYPAASAQTKRFYVRSFDVILFYTKSDDYVFNDDPNIYMEYSDRVKNALNKDENGIFYYRGGSHDGKKLSQKVYIENKGVFPRDVWTDVPYIRANTREYQGFSTQKPERLLRRIILASSREGDIIADFFCGSGTTIAVAEKLKRRWIGCDISKNAIQITKKRILSIKNSNNLHKWKKKYDRLPREFKILGLKSTMVDKWFPIEFFAEDLKKYLLDCEYQPPKFEIKCNISNNELTLEILNYKIPYLNLISPEITDKITNFSDWIDYWAIDFNYNAENKFQTMWVSFRTPKMRKLKLISDPYPFETPGIYDIKVKLIDICGIEITKKLRISIS